LQVVRDYLAGSLDISLEELRELVRPSGEEEDELEELEASPEDFEGLVGEILSEMREQHQLNLRDLVQLSNSVIGKKDAHMKALTHDVLGRGLEDVKLCTPAERNALRELLQDVESLCALRIAGRGQS